MELASLGPFIKSPSSASQRLSLQPAATLHKWLCFLNYQNKYLNTCNDPVLLRTTRSR